MLFCAYRCRRSWGERVVFTDYDLVFHVDQTPPEKRNVAQQIQCKHNLSTSGVLCRFENQSEYPISGSVPQLYIIGMANRGQ